jgi:hypothetical protein
MSWIGETATVRNLLMQVGADKNEEGYKLSGFIVFGMGDDEVVIPDDVEYYIHGVGHCLAEDLLRLGAGVAVRMF